MLCHPYPDDPTKTNYVTTVKSQIGLLGGSSRKTSVAGLPGVHHSITHGKSCNYPNDGIRKNTPGDLSLGLFIDLEITIVTALTLQFGKSDEHL